MNTNTTGVPDPLVEAHNIIVTEMVRLAMIRIAKTMGAIMVAGVISSIIVHRNRRKVS